MTLLQLRTRVEQNIAEPIATTGWFTPAAVKDWLNAGIEMVFLKMAAVNPNYFGIKTTTFSFQANQQENSVSGNPFEIRHVEILDNGVKYFLEEGTLADKHEDPETGEPHSYYWYTDYSGASPVLKIGLTPTPDRSATDNAKVYFVPRPTPLSADGDSPDLPSEFHELVAVWATILALRSDQRPTHEWQSEFNFRLANMLGFASRGRSGGPIYVNYTESY